MIQLGACGLILLLLFNLTGPAILLLALQATVRAEMAAAIRNCIPDSELEHIAVSQAEHGSVFQRIGRHEFRYKGKLYDIVRIERRGAVTVYGCINDTREEQLFKSMEELVRESINKKKSNRKAPLRRAAKHLISHAIVWRSTSPPLPFVVSSSAGEYQHGLYSTTSDVPTPPPRLLSAA